MNLAESMNLLLLHYTLSSVLAVLEMLGYTLAQLTASMEDKLSTSLILQQALRPGLELTLLNRLVLVPQ